MNNSNVINQVIILFLIIGVGYYAKKRGIINEEINKGLTRLLLEVTLPLMIVVSFNYSFSQDIMKNMITLFLYSCGIHVFLIFLGYILYRKREDGKREVLRFSTVFSNCGFMGYPVLGSLYGNMGVLYAAIFNIPFNIFSWTFGVMLFTGDKNSKNFKKVFLNPGILSVIVGLAFFIFSIKLPQTVYSSFKLVGDMTTPLSMIIVGSMLAEVKFMEVFKDKSLYNISFVRLILVPILTYLLLFLIKADPMIRNIAVMVEAMPVAATTAIFAEAYNKEPKFASQVVFVTTLFSVATIPIIITYLT